MEQLQVKKVEDAADWVADFLLGHSCSEKEVEKAKICIINEKIDLDILASMSTDEIRKEMQLTFGDAKRLKKAWLGKVYGC